MPKSDENLFKILPIGFLSKNLVLALIIFFNILSWSFELVLSKNKFSKIVLITASNNKADNMIAPAI